MPLSTIEPALGTILLNDQNNTPEGTMATMRLLRISLAYLESRYRHQIADRHRELEQRAAPAKLNGEDKPKNKGGRPRGTGKNQRAAAAPQQPQMFEAPHPVDGAQQSTPSPVNGQ